jgi:hypothetical protein
MLWCTYSGGSHYDMRLKNHLSVFQFCVAAVVFCRRCKSFDDLQKHFKQLHEREHKKKLGAPKKFANKYAKSDKAARVR